MKKWLYVFFLALIVSGCSKKDPGEENIKETVKLLCLVPQQDVLKEQERTKEKYKDIVYQLPEDENKVAEMEKDLKALVKKKFIPFMTEQGYQSSSSIFLYFAPSQYTINDMGYTTSMKSIELEEHAPSGNIRTFHFTAMVECIRPEKDRLEMELSGRAQCDQEGSIVSFLTDYPVDELIRRYEEEENSN